MGYISNYFRLLHPLHDCRMMVAQVSSDLPCTPTFVIEASCVSPDLGHVFVSGVCHYLDVTQSGAKVLKDYDGIDEYV